MPPGPMDRVVLGCALSGHVFAAAGDVGNLDPPALGGPVAQQLAEGPLADLGVGEVEVSRKSGR